MWFTKQQIYTPALDKVVKGNKTYLSQEIKEIITEDFIAFEVDILRYTATDLFEKLNKGVEQKTFIKPFYQRISTHTARRTFITIMRNIGIADKTIMSISGHKDIKTFNMYHQVNNDAKINAVKSVFDNFQ